MEQYLKGRTALVCGASRGIGRAIAREFCFRGAQVIGVARDEKALQGLKAELGASFVPASLDLAKSEDLKTAAKKLAREFSPITILINNNGGPKGGPLAEANPEEMTLAFQSHVLSAQVLLQEFLPAMREEKFGRIVNILSTSVKVPIVNLGVSNTIRSAMANWAKTLSVELGPLGVTVNNVLPGFTLTDRLSSLKTAAATRLKKTESEIESEWLASIPARRFAQPEELAQAVSFLVSPMASYINGINLPVDGGRTGTL